MGRWSAKHSDSSSGLQQKFDLDGFINELDLTTLVAVEDSRLQQGRHIAMNRFHIAPCAPRHFADRQRASATHNFK